MPRGRPRKPIALLKAQGTFNTTRHDHRQVEPTSGTTVKMPRSLKGEAAKFWKSVVPKLEEMNILDGIDAPYLETLSRSWSNWHKEQAAYEAGDGHIYRVSCAWTMFDKIASKFGFSPVDRTRLAIDRKSNEPDPFEEWLKEARA